MKFINLKDLNIETSKKLKFEKKLKNIIDEKDQKKIKEYLKKPTNQTWKEIKNKLSELSSGNCWYCESQQVRSDKDVDHFRPKSEVSENKEHKGYWWLAYEISNYRYSCEYCNRPREGAGKREHFPLFDETKRCINKDEDITKEYPLLMDPLKKEDTELIYFLENGKLVERGNLTSKQQQKVEKSIKIFNLNHQELLEERLKEVSHMKSEILLYQFCPEVTNKNGENIIKSLNNGPYFSAKLSYLKGRRDLPIIQKILSDLN